MVSLLGGVHCSECVRHNQAVDLTSEDGKWTGLVRAEVDDAKVMDLRAWRCTTATYNCEVKLGVRVVQYVD